MGNADPPLRWGSPQAFLHGAADMAVAALVALAERHRSGRGQLADVSAQVSCVQSSFCYTLNEAWAWPPMHRSGDGIDFGTFKVRWTYPAADGEVSITFSFGEALAHFTELPGGSGKRGLRQATRDTAVELNQRLFAGTVPAGGRPSVHDHRSVHGRADEGVSRIRGRPSSRPTRTDLHTG
jgi:crotonobetainyl-CoA:carnitine CoA-transferase CaiB-like acyl-CoA transferase